VPYFTVEYSPVKMQSNSPNKIMQTIDLTINIKFLARNQFAINPYKLKGADVTWNFKPLAFHISI
jgi:hypothetical protein